VRRVIASLLLLGFGLSVHASIPGSAAARSGQVSINGNFDRSVRPSAPLPLTAIPADRRSFYSEFYGTEELTSPPVRKPGLFRRLTSVIKKTVQKVNLIPN
jgi:hypothetical protein